MPNGITRETFFWRCRKVVALSVGVEKYVKARFKDEKPRVLHSRVVLFGNHVDKVTLYSPEYDSAERCRRAVPRFEKWLTQYKEQHGG